MRYKQFPAKVDREGKWNSRMGYDTAVFRGETGYYLYTFCIYRLAHTRSLGTQDVYLTINFN